MEGLQNLGSTCALNTLIQMICRTPILRDSILLENINNNTLAFELKEVIDLLHNKKCTIAPKKFVYKFFEFISFFQKGEQYDISELWLFLFNKISDELCKEYNFKYKSNIFEDESMNDKCDIIMKKINKNKYSKLLQNTQGITLNTVKCKHCDDIINNFEPFIMITLDIPDKQNITIAEMIYEYFKPLTNIGNWKCDKCNKHTEYVKGTTLWKLPNLLIFVINRFSNIFNKNNKPISFDSEILLFNKFNYKLNSCALHFGNLNGGHYASLCLIDDKFILYDDLNVSVINNPNVLYNNKDIYMVIYSLQ